MPIAKYDLHPVLLVVCQDAATAAWAAGPQHIGPRQWASLDVRPLVLGPHNVRPVTDLQEAVSSIPLATLSAITHANDPGIVDMLKTLATALQKVDEDDALIFAELTELGLGKSPAGRLWRQLMTVDLSSFRSETSQRLRAQARTEGRAEGRAEGLAVAVIHTLERNGITITAAARERITSCTEPERLLDWLDKSITVNTVDSLFEDPA